MSVEIWPRLPPEELKTAIDGAQKRELEWLLNELHETLTSLKHGLEDCYALLAPTEPGSTLLVSTPRNEIVKGVVTRVGTRIIKGTLNLRMRTLASQTLTLDPDHPIHLGCLTTLHTLLTHSIDLLTLTLSYSYPPSTSPSTHDPHPVLQPQQLGNAVFIAAQLRLLAQSIAEASALLKGPPLTEADPTWTTRSASPAHFDPPLPPNISFHIGLQDSQLVLWLRALEPAGAPVNLGMKFALAIGTARRLEHDEADKVFDFQADGNGGGGGGEAGENGMGPTQVFVREKVRVETPDPSLMSLSAKLNALSHTLALARRNLAAVMGDEQED